MEAYTFSYNDVAIIGTYIIAVAGLYWRMKIDLRAIDQRQKADTKMFNLKIAEITQNCNNKWFKHDEAQDKFDAILDAILSGIGDVKGDMKAVKTHIEYLREKK